MYYLLYFYIIKFCLMSLCRCFYVIVPYFCQLKMASGNCIVNKQNWIKRNAFLYSVWPCCAVVEYHCRKFEQIIDINLQTSMQVHIRKKEVQGSRLELLRKYLMRILSHTSLYFWTLFLVELFILSILIYIWILQNVPKLLFQHSCTTISG